jgi:hypothetical protein
MVFEGNIYFDQQTWLMVKVILAVIIGTLLAIVYSMRLLVLMERRVARMEMHIEKIAEKIVREEYRIERQVAKKRK